MPTLGKTLSADAREFVSGGSYADHDQSSKSEKGRGSSSSRKNSSDRYLHDGRSSAALSEDEGSASHKQHASDKKAQPGSDISQSKKRTQGRGKSQRGALPGPIPLGGHLHDGRTAPGKGGASMVPNFLPAMPGQFGLEAGFQTGTGPMMPGMEVHWMHHALPPPHMGYSMPVGMHTGGLPMQPMAAPAPASGMFPAMPQAMPFWGHTPTPMHASPAVLPQRYTTHPMRYPMEEMAGIAMHPMGYSRTLQERDMPRTYSPGDVGLHQSQWLPYRHTIEAREDSRLDKFKQCGAYRTWSYKDVRGHVVDFCKDKAGSHFIQSLLEDGPPEQVTGIINEAKESILVLMKDAFGNYVVQKMLEKANAAERKWMLQCICGDRLMPNRVVALSKDHHSCRVIQTALQVFDMKDKIEVMSRLLEGQSALDLVAEQNGNHVIQKCIECIKPASKLEPLVQALFNGKTSMPSRSPQGQTIQLQGEIISMCQNVYGCRVVQRLLMYAEGGIRAQIIEEVLKDVVANAVDTYSNYVIQHILVNGPEDARKYVWEQLGDHIMELSRNKCASNVIEKCLATGDRSEVRKWVDTLCTKHDKLAELMKDQFGNYVCFTAFLKAEEAQRQVFVEVIRWSLHALRSSTYGKNYLIKLVVSSETSSYFTAEELGVTPVDIDKFKKMQQTAQSNRSGNKAATAVTFPTRTSAASSETAEDGRSGGGAQTGNDNTPGQKLPTFETGIVTADGALPAQEAIPEKERSSVNSLPPNGLVGNLSHTRRDRHLARGKDQYRGQRSGGRQASEAAVPDGHASTEQSGSQFELLSDGNVSEITRHGSFEKDLVKLPRTRSHAKSEGDLERPHQVSVTADGAGPPVTRAPIGS